MLSAITRQQRSLNACCRSVQSLSTAKTSLSSSSTSSSTTTTSSSSFATLTTVQPTSAATKTTSYYNELSSSTINNRSQNTALLFLVENYRRYGHLRSQLDPLQFRPQVEVAELNPALYGLNDLNQSFQLDGIITMNDNNNNVRSSATLKEIIDHLESTYSSSIGLEVNQCLDENERQWFYQQLESRNNQPLSPAQKMNLYSRLLQSEVFDHFMTIKFGQFKRYGLEGAESFIAFMEQLIITSTSNNNNSKVTDIVIGMPHRGRFNLLISLLDYPARAFFAKIKGQSIIPEELFSYCDVASHIFQSVTKKFDKQNDCHVTLLPNPSHLEAVNPVTLGKAKAKQDHYYYQNNNMDAARDRVLPITIHGDSACIGQGITTETLQLQSLPDYNTNGNIHVIVNNQIGFTTDAYKSRTSRYSSDIMKLIDAPVVHVNAEQVEDVLFVAKLAAEYRKQFRKDIMIDIVGYRRHGHNEVDEPAFTQPLMYKNIRSRQSVVKQYEQQLIQQGLLTDDRIQKLKQLFNDHLEKELQAVPNWKPDHSLFFQGNWKGYSIPKTMYDIVDTGVDAAQLREAMVQTVKLPEGFNVHDRLRRSHIEPRMKMSQEGKNIDWATAEACAFVSLLNQGHNIRFAGQDVERGTFSHRHAVFTDQQTNEKLCPIQINRDGSRQPGHFLALNSNLSELAVLGYEYGYSWENPKNLVLWEAQFGDFHNTAQTIIDTFLTTSESKWMRSSGMVMLLPHGYDGTGPEHSSSRIERWLLSSDDSICRPEGNNTNIIVANCTTPAQYFHILRRQQLRNYRRPLIMITPKTLLRLNNCVSTLEEMAPGTHFQTVLDDPAVNDKSKVSTVVLVSGKIYYDIDNLRKKDNRTDMTVIRLEELSPFPYEQLQAILAKYPAAKNLVWCQEEPENQGAYSFVLPRIQQVLSKMNSKLSVKYVGRPPLPSPAVGYGIIHKKQEAAVFSTLMNVK